MWSKESRNEERRILSGMRCTVYSYGIKFLTSTRKWVRRKSLDQSQTICLTIKQEKTKWRVSIIVKQVELLWARASHSFVLDSSRWRELKFGEGKQGKEMRRCNLRNEKHSVSWALSLPICWKHASNADHPRQLFVELLHSEAMESIWHTNVFPSEFSLSSMEASAWVGLSHDHFNTDLKCSKYN